MSPRAVVFLAPLTAFAFAAAFVGFEYINGGVKTHHFLARADLPGFSNWLSLLILPALGAVVAVRANLLQTGQRGSELSSMLAAAAGSSAHGAALAASFVFGLEQVSVLLFAGLWLVAVACPVHRAEYIFGFVLGMTLTFGPVIPLTISLVLAAMSFAVRQSAALAWSSIRKWREKRTSG